VDGDRWWETPGAARVVIDAEGRILEGNAAALELLGSTLEQLRSSPPAAFTVPEIRPMVPWILQLLHDTGELHSTSVVRRGDGGSDVTVEFHLTRDGAGPDRHISVMRVVPRDAVDPGSATAAGG
jgi:PAS domain S-box-containing protein